MWSWVFPWRLVYLFDRVSSGRWPLHSYQSVPLGMDLPGPDCQHLDRQRRPERHIAGLPRQAGPAHPEAAVLRIEMDLRRRIALDPVAPLPVADLAAHHIAWGPVEVELVVSHSGHALVLVCYVETSRLVGGCCWTGDRAMKVAFNMRKSFKWRCQEARESREYDNK